MSDEELYSINIAGDILRKYDLGNIPLLEECLEQYLNAEEDWIKAGYSDGFYVYSQIKSLTECAMSEENTDMTSFLLSFRNRHFDAAFMDAVEENETDLLFGLKTPPPIYYSPGSLLEFGTYYWSAIKGAPRQPVKWQSLLLKGDRALILSKYGIDAMPYNDTLTDVTWEDCSLRKWLNSRFLNEAFSSEEKARILLSAVDNPDASDFIKGGNDTKDYIFLLSNQEADSLCTDESLLRKKPSPYATGAGAVTSNSGYCSWLLRSPGSMWMSTSYIDPDGERAPQGAYVQHSGFCVCPALWIKI